MISVHAIRGGSPGAVAEYYLQPKSGCERELDGLHPPGPGGVGRELGLDPDYYLKSLTLGRWVGEGSRAFGLDGPLGGPLGEDSRRAFLNALFGNIDGVIVAKPVTRYDENGTKTNIRVAAYDVTISAPKSVSTLMALAPPAVARAVLAAHDRRRDRGHHAARAALCSSGPWPSWGRATRDPDRH